MPRPPGAPNNPTIFYSATAAGQPSVTSQLAHGAVLVVTTPNGQATLDLGNGRRQLRLRRTGHRDTARREPAKWHFRCSQRFDEHPEGRW